jgi:hypothetical protein
MSLVGESKRRYCVPSEMDLDQSSDIQLSHYEIRRLAFFIVILFSVDERLITTI